MAVTPPAGDSPTPPPSPTRDWSRGLLGWYYSPKGTLIRVVLYLAVIAVVAWKFGWIGSSTPTAGPQSARTLQNLEVTGWQKKRWLTVVPESLSMSQLPYIEVTLTEPPAAGRKFGLEELAEGLHLFTADSTHRMVSLPVVVEEIGDDAHPAARDDATKPRSFNGQWFVSFRLNPETLDSLPAELVLGYLDPNVVPPGGSTGQPQMTALARLTAETFKGTQMRATPAAGSVAAPVEKPVPSAEPKPAPAP